MQLNRVIRADSTRREQRLPTSLQAAVELSQNQQEEAWPQKPAAFLDTASVTWPQHTWTQKNYLATKVVTMAMLHIWFLWIV